MGATHESTEPFPLPIRVSAGRLVIGLSGKIRIQVLPPRLRVRLITRRAASIWRALTYPLPVAWSPIAPKLTALALYDSPVIRPRICLRYLVRFGIIMA